jgi:hypothetical protein
LRGDFSRSNRPPVSSSGLIISKRLRSLYADFHGQKSTLNRGVVDPRFPEVLSDFGCPVEG